MRMFNRPTIDNRKLAPCTSSWWLDAANFYRNARTRFPESGTAQVNREKEFTGTQVGPSLKVRGSRLRREKREQLGYRT